MANWTPEKSRILSQLLDEVVGTPEMIDIRQDYCRIKDCLGSILYKCNYYFTGSKAEGLNLPGSDEDYMFDINEEHHLKVIQSLDESLDISPYSVFFMCTENVHPGFALLQHVNQNTLGPFLSSVSQRMYGAQNLSSDLLANNYFINLQTDTEGEKWARQGPSVERWTPYSDKSESGTDNVPSIHCPFWPDEAEEWVHRLRNFDWPTLFDVSSIIQFGCHLVPVGHPLSDMKAMEWRISFSMAERALVWSFNHVQMQCYAFLKIILKEFIKVQCSPQNQVLCSYFIKTFLFWKYEATELNFWRADNLRECIKFLLSEFYKFIQEGVLRHYFIPRFNLLSIKLTRAAQIELLQLCDIIVERDISIIRECKTLKNVWLEFLKVRENRNVVCNLQRRYMLMNDKCMIHAISLTIPFTIARLSNIDKESLSISKLSTLDCKTHLKTMVIRNFLLNKHMRSLFNSCGSGNKGVYQLQQTAQRDTFSCDISTCKLWCATFLYMKGDYLSTLNIVTQVLSNIPPYAMNEVMTNNDCEQLYVDMLLDSDTEVNERARKAWIFNLYFVKDSFYSELIPVGIQIEFHFSDVAAILSPITCAYYLQFLCYHEMHQYDRRECALQQLMEVAYNYMYEPLGNPVTTWNIAGHCLLLAGKRAQARDMFYRSYTLSQRYPPLDKYNSAPWYLQNCCWTIYELSTWQADNAEIWKFRFVEHYLNSL